MKGGMYRRAYRPNEGGKASPKTYSPTPEEYKKSIEPDQVDQEGRNPLHMAILQGGDDDVHLERVIKAGCDVNQADKDGHRGVHYAAERGYTRCLQKLIKHGADLNIFDDCDYSPLMLAARHNHPNLIRILTKAGAQTNLSNKKQERAMHYAVCKGNLACVENLLIAKDKVNVPDCEGNTPLMFATHRGHSDIMKALLAGKADPDRVNNIGICALHWAATSPRVELIQILIEAGAELDCFDKFGFSPFVYAIQANNHQALRCLLAAGCDRSTVDGLNGTALSLACLKGHNECAEILLETGDDPDEIGFFGLTPLMSAGFESHIPLIETLLKYGANPNVPGRMNATPLIKCLVSVCCKNAITRHKIVAMLIRAGADVNIRLTAASYFTMLTNGRNCPLSFAMCSGYVSLVRMLLLAGSTVRCSEIHDWVNAGHAHQIYNLQSIIEPVKEWKMAPKSLKYICRMVIRENIRSSGWEKSNAIRRLPIALALQNYVDFRDLDEIEVEEAAMDKNPSASLLMQHQFGSPCPASARVLEGTFMLQSFQQT